MALLLCCYASQKIEVARGLGGVAVGGEKAFRLKVSAGACEFRGAGETNLVEALVKCRARLVAPLLVLWVHNGCLLPYQAGLVAALRGLGDLVRQQVPKLPYNVLQARVVALGDAVPGLVQEAGG